MYGNLFEKQFLEYVETDRWLLLSEVQRFQVMFSNIVNTTLLLVINRTLEVAALALFLDAWYGDSGSVRTFDDARLIIEPSAKWKSS